MTALDELKEKLVAEWDEADEKLKEQILTERKSLPDKHDRTRSYSKEFLDLKSKYTVTDWEVQFQTTAHIHEANVEAADKIIKNLIQRVEKKIGTITDYSGITVNPDNEGFAILNGYFKGEKGTCEVRSIRAGGYNIQKRHIRVLVK